MRQIKFRAWDKKLNRMEFNWFAVSCEGKEIYDGNEWTYKIGKDVEIMQFTGLLDKNGKEIYESDIVKHEFEGEYGPYEHRDTVEYHEGAFYPVCEKPGNEFEVIGNIYSNPDLL